MAQRAPRLSPPAGLVGLLPTAAEVSHDPGDVFVEVAVSVRLARTEMGADSLSVREEPSAEMADGLGCGVGTGSLRAMVQPPVP